MKGKLFVCLYSAVLIGLFGACCYLMTIVNPPPLPGPETRRYHAVHDVYPRDLLLPRENPDYGLEKIPEGVDADEFRKRMMTKVTKYDSQTEKIPYEPGQRVVPPIWPSDSFERKTEKPNSRKSVHEELQSSSPVKGHRRSISDDSIQDSKESPESILLKIVNDNGHKKIEIKFISGENMNTKKFRRNRSPNRFKPNVTNKKIPKVNESKIYSNYDDVNDNVIQIKADDIIILNIVNNSEVLLIKSVSTDGNYNDDVQQSVTNTTDIKFLNKSWVNHTKLIGLEEAENRLKDGLMHTDYTFGLWFNSENRSIDSKNFGTSEYNYNLVNSTAEMKSFNDTRASNQTTK